MSSLSPGRRHQRIHYGTGSCPSAHHGSPSSIPLAALQTLPVPPPTVRQHRTCRRPRTMHQQRQQVTTVHQHTTHHTQQHHVVDQVMAVRDFLYVTVPCTDALGQRSSKVLHAPLVPAQPEQPCDRSHLLRHNFPAPAMGPLRPHTAQNTPQCNLPWIPT